MKKNTFCVVLVTILISFLLFPNFLFAVGSTGIENASFSAKAIGQGNAVVAQADEPAAISYNPAGIVQLPGLQVQPNIHFLSVVTSFKSRTPDTIPGEKSSGTIVPVPTGYITLNPGQLLGDRIAFGVGSDSPFGLMNKYDSDHPTVHYSGWRNWFKMYTIKPTVAVKLLDWLSIGGGPMNYRVYDWGGIQAYPNNLIVAGLPDGQVRLNLAGQHWGWQAGVLAKPHKKHQFGFYFRSPVVVNTKGLIKVEGGLTPAFGTTANFETGGNAKYPLPLVFTWAYAFKPTDKATIEFDFSYTRWSTFERLHIGHDSVASPTVNALNDTILNAIGRADKDYRDSFGYNLGGNYQLTKNLKWLIGGWYYTHAGPNSSFIPAIADGDRIATATGFNCKIGKYLVLDMMYSPSWNIPRRINNSVTEGLGASQDGKYSTFLQELSISITYKWDDIFEKFGKKQDIEEAQISQTDSLA